MPKTTESYKKTEKWWLALVVLFYVLYNLPGVPPYGNARAAIIHGALTIIPLWIVIYGGMFILHKQRRLKEFPNNDLQKSEPNSEWGES
ncbi:MAG: hypothetical protein WBI44_04320 [Syntrophaceticus sp.]